MAERFAIQIHKGFSLYMDYRLFLELYRSPQTPLSLRPFDYLPFPFLREFIIFKTMKMGSTNGGEKLS